jgi:uncharacterized phage-associated protein
MGKGRISTPKNKLTNQQNNDTIYYIKNRRCRMYSSIDIGKYIVLELRKRGIKITNLKLQKMLYYVQAYSLLQNNKPLYKEPIEARKLGPIVPVVHNAFRWAGSSNILVIEKPNPINDEDKKLINDVLDIVGNVSSKALVDISHTYDSWKNAFENQWDKTIYLDDIKKCHKNYYF